MKKIIALFFMLALVGGVLFAGGSSQQQSGGFRTDVFWYQFSDTFLAGVRNAMTDEFQKAGIAFQHHDCNNSQTTQTQMIQTAINQGVEVRQLVLNKNRIPRNHILFHPQ